MEYISLKKPSGTFAWFNAQTTLGLSTAGAQSAKLQTNTTTLALGNYTIAFSISSVTKVELSYKYDEATTTAGRNEAVAIGDVVVGGLVNGSAYEDIVWRVNGTGNSSAKTARVVGTYTITASWADTTNYAGTAIDAGTDPRSSDEKAAMADLEYTIEVGKSGNVVLLNAADNPSVEAESHTATVAFTNDGTLGDVSVDHGAAFAIRTTNHGTTAEGSHDNDKIVIASGSLSKIEA